MLINQKGSISIFLACIFLVLITFTCTIIDVARINVAKVQAERALFSAGHSVLASYDSQLQSQYGIFGRTDYSEELNDTLLHYVEPTLNPNIIKKETNPYLNSSQVENTSFNLYQYNIKSININQRFSLSNSSYLKLQILEFMKYRAPLVALEPFIDRLNIINRASKTTEIIEEKNNIVTEVQVLENSFIQLETLIDGILIDNGKLKTSTDGRPLVTSHYIKRIFTQDETNASYSAYTTEEIPLASLRDTLESNVLRLDETIIKYKSSLNNCEEAIGDAISYYKRLLSLKDRLNRLKKRLSYLDSSSESYKSLKSRINDTKREIKESKKQIKEAVSKFKESDTWIYNEAIPIFNMLYEESDLTYPKTYIDLHRAALGEIEKIKAQSPSIVKKIEEIKPSLENKEGQFIQNTCTSINNELQEYEKLLGINEDSSLSLVNDLLAMEVTLNENINVLKDIEKEVTLLIGSKKNNYNYWWHKATSTFNDEDLKELLDYFPCEFGQSIGTASKVDLEGVYKNLDIIETKLDDYNRNLFFDYSSMNYQEDDPFDLDLLITCVKNSFPQVNLPQINKKIDIAKLPSNEVEISQELNLEPIKEINIESNNNMLDVLKKITGFMENEFFDLRNALYINEYVVGMFRCATEHKDNKMDPDDIPLTLNHYFKNNHYLNYEVEYILFGHENETSNLMATIGTIFAIRIALNTISLLSDFDRMKMINNLANSIAGWWSLGIGSIVIVVVLTFVWAIIESVSDMQRLLNGESVPLVKDSYTWETDLDNGTAQLYKKTNENRDDDANVCNSQTYLPTFSYVDYLRVLLLSNIVNEDKKLLRILDIIQLNLCHERNEDVNLKHYITAFETEAVFEIEYIFFKLPFMPTKAKKLGNTFTFSKTVTLSY